MRAASVARVLAVAALVLAAVAVRVLWGAHHELGEARERQAAGDVPAAIVHYRRAIGWYVPLNPYGPRAIAALRELAAQERAAGRTPQALAAARAIHAGIASARSTFTPYGRELRESDELVSALQAGLVSPRVVTAPSDPSALLSALAFLAWLGFVGSAFRLVTVHSDAAGRLTHGAGRMVAAMGASAALFALSLALA